MRKVELANQKVELVKEKLAAAKKKKELADTLVEFKAKKLQKAEKAV